MTVDGAEARLAAKDGWSMDGRWIDGWSMDGRWIDGWSMDGRWIERVAVGLVPMPIGSSGLDRTRSSTDRAVGLDCRGCAYADGVLWIGSNS